MSEKINYKDLFTRANVLITIFGLLPAAGYVIGISFYEGRLSGYGISSETFPLALQDIYVEAFWAVGWTLLNISKVVSGVLSKVVTPPGLLLAIGSLISISVIAYFPIKHKSSIGVLIQKGIKPIEKIFEYLDSEKNAFTKAMSITGSLYYFLVSILCWAVIISICWAGLPALAYYQGRDVTAKKIDVFFEKGCYMNVEDRLSNCKKLISSDGKNIYEGLLVAHASGYVAFFNKQGSYVAKFPENGVIVTTLKSNMPSQGTSVNY